MRFFARLAIAIATLLISAILCWGQQLPGLPNYGNFGGPLPFAGGSTPQQVGFTGQQPPGTVEGTWVADDGYDQGNEAYEAVPQPPEQLGLGSFEVDGSWNGPGGEECDCDECRAAAAEFDPPGRHRKHGGGMFAPLWCSDLWNEVHAHRRMYVQVDYLSFWTKGNQLPPLVTTSPLGTPQSQAGVLPVSATTAILFGGNRVDLDRRNGARINFGYWLVDGEFLGIEGQYLALEEQNTVFNAVSNFSGDPNSQILARPFFNVDPNLPSAVEDAAIIAFPAGFILGPGTGTLDGSVDIRTTSHLQSAGALLRKLIWIDFTMQRRLDLLLGYRFFRIGDSVTINDQSTFIPSAGPIPMTEFASQDVFSSRNQFHGGEIGLKWQSHHGRLSTELIAKCAFGNNRQVTFIDGFNTITAGGITTENVGGLLAQPTNIGTHRRNTFAILPEADANLRWDITCNLRGTIGYTFIYINRVQRSGDAIDRTLNPTQINGGTLEGEARPAFFATDTAFWAHGATAGVEYRW